MSAIQGVSEVIGDGTEDDVFDLCHQCRSGGTPVDIADELLVEADQGCAVEGGCIDCQGSSVLVNRESRLVLDHELVRSLINLRAVPVKLGNGSVVPDESKLAPNLSLHSHLHSSGQVSTLIRDAPPIIR